MKVDLEKEDLDFILESLEYTKQKFENYEKYPSGNFREDRIDFVIQLQKKLKKVVLGL
ncbi:hypothetical protein [Sunxiuqinia dokdonensis]|uniref:Uncharacterized protein n=1 Tax=Sunxiuqinia dokdonensis TaxID=1409788 RepID=A0A0L8V7C1_9BACT|nr:hypothetical protein [Sunxiuqinia dokdonensis]KOH44102.1 hypothetical protein NC99_30950 [Sunxiuqinia dokdonensis]